MEGRKVLRYSLAFQQKVVGEIESDGLSVYAACKKYGITGSATIQRWIRKLGKNHLLGKVMRIEMSDERDRVKELEKEKQKLESALAQAQLKIMAMPSRANAPESSQCGFALCFSVSL